MLSDTWFVVFFELHFYSVLFYWWVQSSQVKKTSPMVSMWHLRCLCRGCVSQWEGSYLTWEKSKGASLQLMGKQRAFNAQCIRRRAKKAHCVVTVDRSHTQVSLNAREIPAQSLSIAEIPQSCGIMQNMNCTVSERWITLRGHIYILTNRLQYLLRQYLDNIMCICCIWVLLTQESEIRKQ